MYQAVHNLLQTLSLVLCALWQSLFDTNKIGLPVTNLPSSWCIYTNRERAARAYPHFIINTNTPGVNGVSSCEKHTKRMDTGLIDRMPAGLQLAAVERECTRSH